MGGGRSSCAGVCSGVVTFLGDQQVRERAGAAEQAAVAHGRGLAEGQHHAHQASAAHVVCQVDQHLHVSTATHQPATQTRLWARTTVC